MRFVRLLLAGRIGCSQIPLLEPMRVRSSIRLLIETAKANGVEPYLWLRRVLRELHAAKTVGAVEALLPWNLNMQALSS